MTDDTKALIEVPTDLRNAPRHLSVQAKVSFLVQMALMGIAIGREALKAGGNVAVICTRAGDFKRIRNFEEMKALYSGDDKPV